MELNLRKKKEMKKEIKLNMRKDQKMNTNVKAK